MCLGRCWGTLHTHTHTYILSLTHTPLDQSTSQKVFGKHLGFVWQKLSSPCPFLPVIQEVFQSLLQITD